MKWVRVPGDGSARRQQVEGLTNGEAHTFEVRAGNRQEWGPAAEATATPAAGRTVSFAAAAYQSSEGGDAATVTVRLSRSASEALSIPITVNPPSGDYTVTWPGVEDTLSFSFGAERQTFTITATEDDDWDDEEVRLGFGDLPAQVGAGATAQAVVTLEEVPQPLTVTYGAESYRAGEGEDAVSVTVSVSPETDRALKIPISVTPDSETEEGDYAVTWPGSTTRWPRPGRRRNGRSKWQWWLPYPEQGRCR